MLEKHNQNQYSFISVNDTDFCLNRRELFLDCFLFCCITFYNGCKSVVRICYTIADSLLDKLFRFHSMVKIQNVNLKILSSHRMSSTHVLYKTRLCGVYLNLRSLTWDCYQIRYVINNNGIFYTVVMLSFIMLCIDQFVYIVSIYCCIFILRTEF